jgi:hypothetical protein
LLLPRSNFYQHARFKEVFKHASENNPQGKIARLVVLFVAALPTLEQSESLSKRAQTKSPKPNIDLGHSENLTGC